MIQIDRDLSAEPPSLDKPEAHRAYARAAEFFADRSQAGRQRQHEFDWGPLGRPDVLASLIAMFRHRCAFCGTDESRGGLILHHFRPLQDTVATDGETSRRHYWWLAYEWVNLYLACNACSRAQGAKFPVAGQRARAGTTQEGLDREKPLLLDPCKDDPERELVYLDTGEVAARGRRGRATIETFQLNRRELVGQRLAVRAETRRELRNAARSLRALDYDVFLTSLGRLFNRDRPFAAQRRQLANQWAQVRPLQIGRAFRAVRSEPESFEDLVGDLQRVTNRVKEEVAAGFFDRPQARLPVRRAARPRSALLDLSPAKGVAKTSSKLQTRKRRGGWSYLESAEVREVEIHNFRAIDHVRLRLNADAGVGSWLTLLGENAAGKTSVLQALALALAGRPAIEALPDHTALLRAGETEGFIRVELTGSRRWRELRFRADRRSFRLSGHPGKIVVAGYGATRLLPRRPGARTATAGIEGLFDPFVPLTPPARWLRGLSPKEFDAVARALKSLLDLKEDEVLRRARGGIELVRGMRRLPLTHLSDGYQGMAGFGLDMMRVFIQRWGSIEAAEGIVLVDELGTHLHPRWQMKVTGSLREAFPRVQFIATTHDPLCLRGLRDGEVAILRQSGRRTFALQDDLPPVSGLAVDQLLTSEHFGLGSTLDPEIEHLFERYYELRAKPRLRPAERREMRQLTAEFSKHRLLGETMRERIALEAADDFIAESRRAKSAEEYYDLKDRTRTLVARAWREARAG